MDTLMLFLRCLWLLTGFTVAKGANVVAGEDRITTFGSNPFTLTCRYTTEVNERPDTVSVQHKRYQSSQFIELFKFNIPANSSSYKDVDMLSKAQLYMNGNSSVSVTYSYADCNDNGTYKCVFSFLREQILYTTSDEMQLAIESEPEVPTMTQSSMNIFTESEEIEFNCSSYVGPSDRTLAWFGVSVENNLTDFTPLANQSDPVQDQAGPRFCIFQRTSRLKVTLTREHHGMNFRCVVISPDQQGQGRSCDPSVCTSSPDINVQYGIRQEDLAIQSDPVRPANTFEAGSSVTLTCDVDGNPDPYFKWVKGQDTVIGEGSNKLILDNLSINDSGIYRCQGNNTVGETTYEVEKSIGITVVLTTTTSTTPTTNTHNVGEVKTTESPEGLAMVTIIVVICAAVFMVIIIIIIIVCCCCRKGKSDKNRREIRMNNSPTGKPNPAFQKSVDRANENAYTLKGASSRISKGPDVLEHTDVPDARNMSRMMIHTPEAGIDQYEPPPVDLSRNDIQFVAGPGALSRPRSRFPVVLDDYDGLYPPESLRHPDDYSSLNRHSGYRDVNMYPPRYEDMGGNLRRNSDDSGVNLDAGYARPDMMFV